MDKDLESVPPAYSVLQRTPTAPPAYWELYELNQQGEPFQQGQQGQQGQHGQQGQQAGQQSPQGQQGQQAGQQGPQAPGATEEALVLSVEAEASTSQTEMPTVKETTKYTGRRMEDPQATIINITSLAEDTAHTSQPKPTSYDKRNRTRNSRARTHHTYCSTSVWTVPDNHHHHHHHHSSHHNTFGNNISASSAEEAACLCFVAGLVCCFAAAAADESGEDCCCGDSEMAQCGKLTAAFIGFLCIVAAGIFLLIDVTNKQ